MYKLFCFDKTLFTALPKNEATARLQAAFSGDYGRDLSDLTLTENALSFSVTDRFGLVYNSFRPDVRMLLTEQDDGTSIEISCRIKRFSRVFASVFLLLLAACEAVMLWFLIQSDLHPAMLLIPPGMAAFMVLLDNCGLRLSSGWIIAAAQNAVNSSDGPQMRMRST